MTEVFFGTAGPIRPVASAPEEERQQGETSPPTNLEVQALSSSAWRVRDSALPENDARSLLGFIEQSSKGFDVMRLGAGHGSTWVTFPSLTEAMAYFKNA